jgi:hypothetical protein
LYTAWVLLKCGRSAIRLRKLLAEFLQRSQRWIFFFIPHNNFHWNSCASNIVYYICVPLKKGCIFIEI